jgi:hypothetical protein
MIAPKPISDTGLSPEQEQALALARARRRRAEAEAAKPAPVASKAPPAPVAKPGPAVPASGMGAMGSRAPVDAAAYAATVPQFKPQPANPNAPNPIDTAWRQGVAKVNTEFNEARRAPTPAEQAAADAEAEKNRLANVEALANSVGAMGFQGDSIAPTQVTDDAGNMVAQANLSRALPVRFGANALNAAGPGMVNGTLEIGDALFGPGPSYDYFGNSLTDDFSDTKFKPRVTFGDAAVAPKPPTEMVPSIPLDPALGAVEGGVDFGGQLLGVAATLGRGVPRGLNVGGVATSIGAKGTPLAKTLGYGTRVAGEIGENVLYAGALGATMAPDGQRAQTAAQFASDPLNILAIPAASLIYRGTIALKTMGARVTPEAVQIQQAMQTLQRGDANPDQLQAAARTIDEMTPPAPDAGPAPSQADPAAPPPGAAQRSGAEIKADLDRARASGNQEAVAILEAERDSLQFVDPKTGQPRGRTAKTQAAPTGTRSKSMFGSGSDYSVSTLDSGVFNARLNRTDDGGAVIFHDEGTIPITPEFAKGKSDEELLAYYFEPLGFQGATKGPTTQGAAQAAPQAPPAAAGAAANPQATQRAQQLLDGVDAGGIPSNPILVNRIARDLGLDVADDAPMADTIERVRTELAQQGQPTVPQGPAGGAQGATQPPPVQPPPAAPVGMAVPPPATATQAASSADVQLPTLTRAEKRAADILIKRLEADGVSWDDVKRVAASMGRRGDSGVYETIGELVAYVDGSSGANMRGLQMAGGTIPGATQERIVGRVAENDARLPQRVTRAATRATGQMAENAVDTLQALNQRLRTESGPRYETFYSAPVDPRVFANEVLPILNTEAGQVAARQALEAIKGKAARLKARVASGKASEGQLREYAHAQEAARSLEGYLKDPIRGTDIPSPYALNRIKRAFDNQIEAAGQGSEIAKDIRGTKTDFADGVSNATGGKYGEALGFYEGSKRLEEAFQFGNSALSKKSWQLKLEMEQGLKGRAWSGGEIEAIAMGVARQIEDLIAANDQRALTMLIKGKALENLATALGDPKAAARFEQSMRRLAVNREWGRRVAKGSDTAMRQASVAEMATEADDAVLRNLDRMDKTQTPPTPFGLGWDLLVSPIIRGAKDSYQRFRYAGLHDPEVNKILAPILGDAATPETLKAADRIISARLAEKAQKQGPVAIGYGSPPKPKPAAPSAKPAPKPKRSPPGNKLKAPGKPPAKTGGKKPPPGTTSMASPAITGALVGGGIGAAANPDDPGRGALYGAMAGGAVAGLGNRLSKMGGSKPKTVKPPPGARVDAPSNVQRGPWKDTPKPPKPVSERQKAKARLDELRAIGLSGKQARAVDEMSLDSIKSRGQATPDFKRGVEVATLRGQGIADEQIASQLGIRGGKEELDRLEELVGAYDWGHPAMRPEFYANSPEQMSPMEIMEFRQLQAKRQTVTPFRKPPPGAGGKPQPVGAKAAPPPFKPIEGAEVIDTTSWTPTEFNAARKQLNEMMQDRRAMSGPQLAELDMEITSLRNALDPPIAPEFADVPMASRFNAPVDQPWPKGSPADTAIKKAIEGKNWTVQSVPLAKVIPTQDGVFFDYAKAAARYAGDDRLPIVVKQGDQYFVADGHHRLMAQGGAGQVRARVIDLAPPSKGPGGKPPTEGSSKLLSAFPGGGAGAQAATGAAAAGYGYAMPQDFNDDGITDDDRLATAGLYGGLGLTGAGLARARVGMKKPGGRPPPSQLNTFGHALSRWIPQARAVMTSGTRPAGSRASMASGGSRLMIAGLSQKAQLRRS